MPLSTATDRAALKLADPAQRLYWALSQYFALVATAPAVLANVAAGIPASPANAGFLPEFPKGYGYIGDQIGSLAEHRQGYRFNVLLFVDLSQYARNLDDFGKCLRDPFANLPETMQNIPAGAAINDASKAGNLSHYIWEQWHLLGIDRAANPVVVPADPINDPDPYSFQPHVIEGTGLWGWNSIWYHNDDIATLIPTVRLVGNILKKPDASKVTPANYYGKFNKITPSSPWDVCDFATYNQLAV